MPLDRPDITTIKTRIEKGIESRLFSNLALLRRAVLRILARVFAGAIHTNYGAVDFYKDQVFIVTAVLEFLKRIGREYGVNIIAASFAEGEIKVFGVEATPIPKETVFVNDQGVEYATLSAELISGGQANILTQAVEPGVAGNIDAGIGLLELVQPISGIENEADVDSGGIVGGVDEESTESFRERLLFRRRNPPMGGNATDYEIWAREIAGVKRAWVYPIHNGLGTVVVVIKSTELPDPTPSTSLISDVQNHIVSKAPVTANVTTESTRDIEGEPGVLIWDFVLEITPDETGFRDAIIKNLTDLLEPFKPGSVMPLQQIFTAIGSSGVDNFVLTGWLLDGQFDDEFDDVDFGDFSDFTYPILGNVSFE